MTKSIVDIENGTSLRAYLQEERRVSADQTFEVRTLAGGVSNKTVLVQFGNGAGWVVKQALPRLRVAVEWLSDPARIGREALGLRWLPRLAPHGTITPLVFEDLPNYILAMAAVPQPHENWKSILLRGEVNPNHIRQFADLLASIFQNSIRNERELAPLFDDRSFFESLRLEPYYAYSAQQVPAAAAFLRDLIANTRSRRIALVHGDYSPKNVLVHQGRLILLDHEVIHWGDPAFDVGFALTHLLSKAHHLPPNRTSFADVARLFWQRYVAGVLNLPQADQLETMAVRHTLGCMLARVAGRSPLEYLSEPQRTAQRGAIVTLMSDPPANVSELIDEFLKRV